MRALILSSSLCLTAGLVGCATPTALQPSSPQVATAIQGTIHGGLQPIANAHVYLMRAGTSGYGQSSISLLTSSMTGNADSLGGYVLSDSSGKFSIPGSYSCSGFDQVYVYAVGGNAGAGANAAAGLMAAIGDCPLPPFNGTVSVAMNEISTVGTAYAIAGFATDPTHVSASSTPLALTDLQNAFANVANLYRVSDASAIGATPAGNGVVPLQTINTLANILAACIQTSGPNSPTCTALFSHATLPGGSQPADTAAAILNIAHNPGAGVPPLYALAAASSPFGPALPAQPNDFTLGINYTGGGLNGAYAIAIDAEGNAWVANLNTSTVTKLAPNGAPLSPSAGFTNGTPLGPVGIAIDLSGNAWIVNAITSSLTKYASSGALLSPIAGWGGGGLAVPQAIASDALGNTWVANYQNSASKFSNGGTPISPPYGYTGGGIGGPASIAVDASGSVWLANTKGSANSVTKFSSAGQAVSPVTGFLGGGLNNPFSVAVDNAGFAWVANFSGSSVTKLAPTGDPVSPSTGYKGGGLSLPYSIAVDGGGNVWVANSGAYSVSELSNSGASLSPATGFTGGLMNGPQAIALDGSGNVWIANSNDITVTELIGASVPVVTPIVSGVKNNQLGVRP